MAEQQQYTADSGPAEKAGEVIHTLDGAFLPHAGSINRRHIKSIQTLVWVTLLMCVGGLIIDLSYSYEWYNLPYLLFICLNVAVWQCFSIFILKKFLFTSGLSAVITCMNIFNFTSYFLMFLTDCDIDFYDAASSSGYMIYVMGMSFYIAAGILLLKNPKSEFDFGKLGRTMITAGSISLFSLLLAIITDYDETYSGSILYSLIGTATEIVPLMVLAVVILNGSENLIPVDTELKEEL